MKYNLRQNFWSKVRRGLALILVAVMVLNIGLQHPIDVKADTSDALIDFINEVSISKATEGDDALTETGDTWSTIKPDVTYGLNLSFRENSGGLQFVENGAQMTYALPAGVAAVAKSGTINISVTLDGVTYVVHDNPFTVDDSGNLVVNFNTADDNYAHLLESSNARFNVVFNAKFNLSNGSNTLDFGNGITKTVIVDASHNASVNKSCSLLSNGKMQYTITVNSSGTSENISIADTITGSALTLDPSSISVSGIDSSLFSTTSSSSTGFNATISKMTHGQTAVITYTADVDYTQADSSTGKISTTQTGNDVEISVTDDSDPSDNTSTTSKEIEATSISSKSGTVVDDGAGTATITWTVVVNSQNLMSLNGKTITDTFGAGEGQSYVTGSFTVKKIAADWSSVTENPTPVTSSEGWSYTFNDTEPYRYEITYQTTADVSTVTTSKTFNNNVSYPYGSKDGTAVYTTTGDNAFTIDKAVSNVSSSQITWTITVHVPKNGISPLVVEDTYPALGGYQDTFSSASITSGLTGDEHGDLDTSDSTKLKYTFYKTAGTSDPGLSATTNGRDVVITVVTNVNSDWLEAAKETSWLQTHKNTATATSNEITIRDTAETTPIAASISKSGSVQGTVDDGSGKKLPYYKYEVKISGVDLNQTNVTITDDLPSYLELYSTSYDHLRFYGGDQYYQGNDSTGTVTASATSGTISFTIPTANIAKNGDAAYGYYKLVYYAKVKNAAELANMTTAALSQDDNTLDIVNNATYSGNTAGSTITYKPDDSELITKELLNSDKINDDSDASNYKIAKYKIKINPDKKTMNSGNHLKLTDTFENLSIIYSSIQFSPAAESYDVSGTTLTAELLDATTYTLTYTCRVNGKGTVNYKNTADLEGFKATNDETKTFEADSSGSGSAFVPSIRVYKQKKGSGNTPLSGATFALYEVTTNLGTEILTPVTKTGGEQVTVTTGDDGTAQIKGVQSKDGWTLGMADEGKRYCIIETVAPTGYKLDQTKYYFQLGEESVYNPSTQTWIYMNDEEMRINNELADTGVLTVTKTLNGLAAGDVTDSFLSGITLTVKDANSATQSKTLKEIKDAYEGGDTTNYGYDATNQKYTWNLSGVGIGAAHVTETVTTPSGYSLTKTYNINGGSAAAYPASAGVPVTVSTTDQSVNLINTYASTNNGKITVSKTYNYHTATPQTFYFALFTDSAGTTRYGDVKSVTMSASDLTAPGTNASATKTVSFTDLAHDTYYVFETDADGKVLDAAAVAKLNYDCTTPLVGVYKEQAVSDDTEHTLTFENTEKKGQIVVKKTVKTAGDNILNATDCGNITLKITGPNSYEKTATLSAIRANSGLSAGSGAYVKASDGSMTYTWTITDLPLGTYEVTESSTDITNYTLSSQTFVVDGTGTSQTYSASNVPASAIAAGKDGNIALTNTYTEDTGKLVLAKALSGDATTDKETFLFYVTLKDRSGNLITGSRTYGGTTYTFDSAGTTEVPVKVGSNVTISGIPVGYTYTVSEKKNANNYAWVSSLATPAYSDHYVYASGTGLTGTIAEATDAKATITNQYQALSKLKITKEVTLDNQPAGTAIPTNDPFTIKVLLKNASNANISGTYNVSYLTDGVATDTGTITFDGTNPTEVSLKNKQSIVIHDVMYGYKYEVTEATYSYTSSDIMGTTEYYGYKNGTITNGTGTLVNNTTSEVTVGNLYREKPAAITIKKNVIYPDGYTLSESLIPADTLFKVHIAFTGTVSDGLHGSVTLTSNEGDVTFKNGETAAITGIPDGLSFTITEPSYSTDGGSNWTALDGTAKVGYYKGNGGDNIYDVTSGTRTTGIAAFTGTTNKDQTFALEIDNVYVPSEIYINKFSNASGTPALNGAKLRIIDTATNAVAKDAKGNNLEWTTDGNPKKITGLVADGAHQYILREINTPEGFQTIQDITFTISNYSTI
nr:DUF5979 domain-containing protein [Lachnospiraceae bacterium]